MTDVNRLPISDYHAGGHYYWIPANLGSILYSEVDDPVGSPDDLSSYLTSALAVGAESIDYFGFSSPSVPSGSTSISVKVTMRIYDSWMSAYASQRVIVGGTEYGAGNTTCPTSFTSYTYTWSNNPKRGSAWTVDDVNGSGSYALQYFGVLGGTGYIYDYKYGWYYYPAYCTQCYLTVSYTAPTAKVYAFGCGVGTVVGSKSTSIG